MFELTVKIKGEDQTLRKKFLVYEERVSLNTEDERLQECVKQTLEGFKGEVESISLVSTFQWE